jgi:hypothetical protein
LSRRLDLPTLARIEIRIIGEERFITITSLGCQDRRGFLLTRTLADEYFALYNDGVVEEIDPITGTPRPEPDPAVRTKDYVVPSQLRGDPTTNTNAGKFSGLMRLAVGCYHVRGLEAPFSYSHAKTHGILKLGIKHWFIEISASGVFAAPVSNTGRCCDSWSIAKYIPTAEEIAEQPSFAPFAETLSLNWAFDNGKPGVLRLVEAGTITAAFSNGTPWHVDCGWAFSASGVVAQNVVQSETGAGASRRWLCSRFRFDFSLGTDGNPVAVYSNPELSQVAQFPDFSGVWLPQDNNTWEKVNGLTDAEMAASTFSSQNAPIHVYYDGEEEVLTRWRLFKATDPGGPHACTTGFRKHFGGGNPHCRLITAAHDGPVCQGPLGESFGVTAGQELGNDGQDAPGPPDEGFFIHNGRVSYGGSTTTTSSYLILSCGFQSPKFSGIFERSTKTIDRWTTVEGAPIITVTETDTLYQLHPDCEYDIEDPIFGGTLHVDFGPVRERRTETKALVYNERHIGTEIFSARTVFVPFLVEREAGLNVVRHNTFFTGDNFQESISSAGRHHARITVKHEKIADIGTGVYPAGTFFTNYTNWEGPASTAVDVGGTIDTTSDPLTTFTPAASAHLSVGPIEVTITVPSEASQGGVMPATALSAFLLGSAASPPEPGDLTLSSPVTAQHGNLLTSDPKLTPPDQTGNGMYLLEFATPVTLGGFAGIDFQDDVLGFVGKA